ncbi:MAG: hypothetical protein ACRDCE_06350 [Cetobacterium sp.]|uniref:hypothetical protein n=1 Tax=Cetobacterium sp. TaxID=2071632 RepID=UPI003EE5FF0D
MEVIFKGANEGKTTEAMKTAAAYGGNVVFFSNEMTEFAMARRFMNLIEEDQTAAMKRIDFFNVTDSDHALAQIDRVEEFLAQYNEEIDLVVLDVSFGISHSQWFDLAVDLENVGFPVVVTQQLARKAAVNGKTQVVKA